MVNAVKFLIFFSLFAYGSIASADEAPSLQGEWVGTMSLGAGGSTLPVTVVFEHDGAWRGQMDLATSKGQALKGLSVDLPVVTFQTPSQPPMVFKGVIDADIFSGEVTITGFPQAGSFELKLADKS